MRYPIVLLDFDHTLFDFDASEEAAFAAALALIELEPDEDHGAAYRTINRELWGAVERGELIPDQVHALRFERFVAHLGADVSPVEVADVFATTLGSAGDLYPGARDVLDELAEVATLAMVTNALSVVQRTRIERLGLADHFAAIVISGEHGVMKPDPAIFDLAFDALGSPDRAGALMVGDSLSSDMRGGAAAGIDTCWLNPAGAEPADRADVTHEIASLAELPAVVRGVALS